jgi:hypothetical protein
MNAAAYDCCVQFYVLFWNVSLRPYIWWQQWRRHGGMTGVCIAAVSQPTLDWMKRKSFGLVRIESHLAEVFRQWRLAEVEMVRKMITKSGKSWRICRELQVIKESMTVNWHLHPKFHPAVYSCKLRVIQTVPRFAESWSDVVCLFVFRQTLKWATADTSWLKERKSNSSTEMTSGEFRLNTWPGFYKKHTLTIMPCGTVSITIPNGMTVKTQILLCSSRSNSRTLT